MLTIKEVDVMRQIYNACKFNDNACILSPEQILSRCNPKYKIDEHTIETILLHLEYDGYYSLTESTRKGKKVYVFNLHAKGIAFEREIEQRKREILYNLILKIALCAVGALVTLVITKFISCIGGG